MDLVQVLVAAFGGAAAMLLVVGFLGRELVTHWLAREAEAQRARLALQGETLLESLRARLRQDARTDDRRFEAAQVMRRYEGPLLLAVFELQSRLFNILQRSFLARYLLNGTPSQREYAIDNTVFLIAQYCGWTEIIRQEIQFIDCDETDRTRRLATLRNEIYGLWQTADFGDALMIWAGEQRAIGELMIVAAPTHLTCMGYAAFLATFPESKQPLIDRLRQAVVGAAGDDANARLLAMQHKLIDVLDLLDPDAVRFPPTVRTKA